MKKIYFTNPYHFVTISPWPLLSSLNVMVLVMMFLEWLFFNSYIMLFLFMFMMFAVCFQWWRDVIRESEFQGFHSLLIMKMIRFSFFMFILSELFFFISFFWSFFHVMLNPPIECGNCWPPVGISPFDPYGIPMVNSFILITSGMTLTLSHHLLILNLDSKSFYLFLTILLGMMFTFIQCLEYNFSSFSISDSVYGSLFFMMTGFHGLHVAIGLIFLSVCFYRVVSSHFLSYHHVGFEAASWYWHFVDVVWLFLYMIVYWWSVN
uniref:Cytochrome c oxidase subunit 3 n=1 Tax=Agenioideus sp. SJW-2017 TaxID=1940100 RepID=A0A1P8VH77_9HYME|nr:cytochrome c oxidase subunit 3 [Agenioideus sp. SJW-2017]